jgi:hypothetical protein
MSLYFHVDRVGVVNNDFKVHGNLRGSTSKQQVCITGVFRKLCWKRGVGE